MYLGPKKYYLEELKLAQEVQCRGRHEAGALALGGRAGLPEETLWFPLTAHLTAGSACGFLALVSSCL